MIAMETDDIEIAMEAAIEIAMEINDSDLAVVAVEINDSDRSSLLCARSRAAEMQFRCRSFTPRSRTAGRRR